MKKRWLFPLVFLLLLLGSVFALPPPVYGDLSFEIAQKIKWQLTKLGTPDESGFGRVEPGFIFSSYKIADKTSSILPNDNICISLGSLAGKEWEASDSGITIIRNGQPKSGYPVFSYKGENPILVNATVLCDLEKEIPSTITDLQDYGINGITLENFSHCEFELESLDKYCVVSLLEQKPAPPAPPKSGNLLLYLISGVFLVLLILTIVLYVYYFSKFPDTKLRSDFRTKLITEILGGASLLISLLSLISISFLAYFFFLFIILLFMQPFLTIGIVFFMRQQKYKIPLLLLVLLVIEWLVLIGIINFVLFTLTI